MWFAPFTALAIMIGSWSAAVAQEVPDARVTPPDSMSSRPAMTCSRP